MLLDFLFKDLLNNFIVLHAVRDLHTKLMAFFTTRFWSDVKEIIASYILDEVVVIGTLPWTLKIDGSEFVTFFIGVCDLKSTTEFFC